MGQKIEQPTVKQDENTDLASQDALSSTHNCPPAPHHDKKFANRTFNIANYWGIGFVINSTLSLFIAYNALTTNWAKNGINKLKNVMRPLATATDAVKKTLGIGKEMSAVQRDLHIAESARSTAEMLCMFIAGCIVLAPMKWMEDGKKKIVDKIDRWRNPEYYRHCAEHDIAPESSIDREDKKTWGRLLGARVGGMASVLGIDWLMQSFNNARAAQGKHNFDTREWQLGGHIHDNISEKSRRGIINFFSRKGIDLEGINHQNRTRLLKQLQAPQELIGISEKMDELHQTLQQHPRVVAAAPGKARSAMLVEVENEVLAEQRAILKGLIHGVQDINELKLEHRTAVLKALLGEDHRMTKLSDISFDSMRDLADSEKTNAYYANLASDHPLRKSEPVLFEKLDTSELKERIASLEGDLSKAFKEAGGIKPNAKIKEAAEKAIFSEQTRLFSKEVSMTFVIATVIYGLSKAGVMSGILSKLGFKKPHEQREIIGDMMKDSPFLPITRGEVDLPEEKKTKVDEALIPDAASHVEKIRGLRKTLSVKPKETHAEKVSVPSSNATLQVGA